jgi:LysR family transcriptional regulator, glycine cleavage system transcriptional activator
VLLAQNILAYDHLRSGRLVIPVALALSTGRAYYLVRPKRGGDRPQVEALSCWLKDEFAALDWTILDALTQKTAARKSLS